MLKVRLQAMPNYDYECQKCGKRFEVFQSMTEKPRKRCPKCRGKMVRLVGTGAGILFRGSGFYQTDYRSESYKESAKREDGKGKETATASSGKTSSAKNSDKKSSSE